MHSDTENHNHEPPALFLGDLKTTEWDFLSLDYSSPSAYKERRPVLWPQGQYLVTDVVEGVGRVAVAGLAPRDTPDVPVAIGALIAEHARGAWSAGALAALWLAEAGAPQGALGYLRTPPVTRALWGTRQRPTV